MAMAPRRVQFGVLGVDTSGGFPRGPLESMAAEEDLHKGLVRMGVSDVAPLTLKEVAHTLGLTFAVTSGVAESYGESVGVEVWGEGMTRHATLMARAATVGLASRSNASTSDADTIADLTTELAHT
ncbi:hypothetical protein B296_00009953 [Ensete ventricosum]|uniref:Uncharacterized protein n=1 Tax=Ensete ventricosum TaxID=4639 RepID=A0A426ZQK2_ENSVE|nr:hypothetical protein B296_00009953 [Ensete ventricosum]